MVKLLPSAEGHESVGELEADEVAADEVATDEVVTDEVAAEEVAAEEVTAEEVTAEEVEVEEGELEEVEVEVAVLAREVLVEFEKYRLSLLGPPQYSVALPPQVMEQSVLAVMLLVEESLLSQ